MRIAGAGSTTTAADGTYTISGIPAGQAQVTVSHLGFFTQNTLVQFKDHQTVEMDFAMDSTRKSPGLPATHVISGAKQAGADSAGRESQRSSRRLV